MASVQKTASGYRAQVAIKGERDSATFRTKREADAWAAARETELRARLGKAPGARTTFREALIRYSDEVTPGKRGARWESMRIDAFLRDQHLPLNVYLADLLPDSFAAWRSSRVKAVATSTVLREMNVLSAVLQQCRREWRLIEESPFSDVRRPTQPDHRDVTITWRQVRAMVTVMGYRPSKPIRSVSQAMAVCFLLALRTGMRAGELCGLEWDRVMVDHVVLLETKTTKRVVPLSSRARRLLARMRGWDEQQVFGLSPESLSSMFRKYRRRLGLPEFTFHDSRHTAATMLARKLDVLDLCKMFGWKDPKHAMIYYNPKPSDIAKRLG